MLNLLFFFNFCCCFVKGLVVGGVLLGLLLCVMQVVVQVVEILVSVFVVFVFIGNVFDLVIVELLVNFMGKQIVVIIINGLLLGLMLWWKEGEMVIINVINKLWEYIFIYWYGIILLFQMDGVLGISFVGIVFGEIFMYKFKVK